MDDGVEGVWEGGGWVIRGWLIIKYAWEVVKHKIVIGSCLDSIKAQRPSWK